MCLRHSAVKLKINLQIAICKLLIAASNTNERLSLEIGLHRESCQAKVNRLLFLEPRPWAGGDYENWEGTLINRGGGAPMVKIKDFTLASKKQLGEGARAPRALHTSRPWPSHTSRLKCTGQMCSTYFSGQTQSLRAMHSCKLFYNVVSAFISDFSLSELRYLIKIKTKN